MKRFKNASLKEYNSFHIDVNAYEVIIVEKKDELRELFDERIFKKSFLILGKGSNILLLDNFNGKVLIIKIEGERIENIDDNFGIVSVGSGYDWDKFVEFTITNNLYGLENLSLIPGSVGASAVQNIGAYGCEAGSFIEKIEYFDIKEGVFKILNKDELKFGYRTSIFKNELKDRAIITMIFFKLHKKPNLNLEYADIKRKIEDEKIKNLTPQILRDLIIEIRRAKLHDPNEIGNAGSFFKNPVITIENFEKLKKIFPDLNGNPSNEMIKISAGWLIEKAGWKGWISDDREFGVSIKHSLVLVNYGNCTGRDLYNLSLNIQKSIKNIFNIDLEPEVIKIGK